MMMSTHPPQLMLAPLLMLDSVTALRGHHAVLQPTSLTVSAGERIAILGPNGAGKSTLLKRIAGLIGGAGAVSLSGVRIETLSRAERARHLAYLPQECVMSSGVSVEQVVTLGRIPHGVDLDDPSPQDRACVSAAMHALRVEAWGHRAVNSLSTGERARVLVARAIAGQAPILLADEPVSALDPRHQIGVLKALADHAAQGRTVIAVMHDLTLAAQWASRILLMQAGRVMCDAEAQEALSPTRLDPLFEINTKLLLEGGVTAITFTAD